MFRDGIPDSCIYDEYVPEVIDTLVQNGIRRDSVLVAMGGGVVQDVAGFVATILYRGISWSFFPTTLLAQADSCIGSKTSINVGHYKNLVGSFHPPRNVVIDTGFLETLPEGEIRSGIGEILHYYLIDGTGRVGDLNEHYDDLLAEPRKLDEHVRASLEIKRPVVERDELDEGERRVFNYGHTFGHAIEAVTGFGISHGQAVTVGMDMANHISMELGWIATDTYRRMKTMLEKNMPSFSLSSDRIDEFMAALNRDKKNRGKELGCVLTRGPGRMEITYLPLDDTFRRRIVDYFAMLG